MALSNTAIPYYYGKFREQVLRGEILVPQTIAMQMARIDALIANPGVYYDSDAINGFVAFCENELTLTDGSDLNLLDTFKLWAEDLLSWFYFVDRSIYVPNPDGYGGTYVNKRVKRRLRRKQYLIVARGAAKSVYGECIQSYTLTCSGKTTKQITVAPTMDQASAIMEPFQTAINVSRGPLFKMLTEGSINNTAGSKDKQVKLVSTKRGIENRITGGLLEVIPMSIQKLQGLRVTCATIDEWLSCDIKEDPIEAIEQGAAKEQSSYENNDYIILATSSEGTIRNGIGDTIKMELLSILKGENDDIHTSIWWYKLDDIKEVNDPNMWIKAQPNIGKTVTYETYQEAIKTAENNPAKRNDILAKRFGIPMEGYTYFFPYAETLCHRKREYWGQPCALGMDLSQGDDFCAFTFMFPLGEERFGIKTRNYISQRTLDRLPTAARFKYEQFIGEGSLIVLPGITLDMPVVYEDLIQHIEHSKYDVRCIGYDPYNADEVIAMWARDNGNYGIVKVIQGSRTESVPLGELKSLSEERRLLFDEEIMCFAMGNCIVIEDTNGNRKLYKRRYDEKIDPVAAMMDAYVSYKQHREFFD